MSFVEAKVILFTFNLNFFQDYVYFPCPTAHDHGVIGIEQFLFIEAFPGIRYNFVVDSAVDITENYHPKDNHDEP